MNKLKSLIKLLLYMVLGGCLTAFLIIPFRDGHFKDNFITIESMISGNKLPAESIRTQKLDVIESNIHSNIFDEFHREFGSDAFLEYEKYLRSKSSDPNDVFMFNYSNSLNNSIKEEEVEIDTNFRIQSHQSDLDNHSNQLNPNNDEYWHSREQ